MKNFTLFEAIGPKLVARLTTLIDVVTVPCTALFVLAASYYRKECERERASAARSGGAFTLVLFPIVHWAAVGACQAQQRGIVPVHSNPPEPLWHLLSQLSPVTICAEMFTLVSVHDLDYLSVPRCI